MRRARRAPGRRGPAARPRCRRPRRRRRRAGRPTPANAARGDRAHPRQVVRRRRVGRARGVERARADGEGARPGHAAGERADRDLRRAAADVDHGERAGRRRVERVRRAVEGEPRLVLPAEDVGGDPGPRADGVHERGPVRGAPDGGRGDHAQALAALLLRGRALLRDDLRDGGERRLGGIRPCRVEAAPDPGEGAELQHLGETARRRLGDQQPRRVRPDVDAGAAHGRRSQGCHDGAVPAERCHRGRRPPQGLRRPRRGARHLVLRAPGRGLRAARAQRRGQDDDGRDPRGLPAADGRHGLRARAWIRARGRGRCASGSGSSCRPPGSTAISPSARPSRTGRACTRARATWTRRSR